MSPATIDTISCQIPDAIVGAKRLSSDIYTVLPVEGAPDDDCTICLAPCNTKSSDKTVRAFSPVGMCRFSTAWNKYNSVQGSMLPLQTTFSKRDATGHNAQWYHENHQEASNDMFRASWWTPGNSLFFPIWHLSLASPKSRANIEAHLESPICPTPSTVARSSPGCLSP